GRGPGASRHGRGSAVLTYGSRAAPADLLGPRPPQTQAQRSAVLAYSSRSAPADLLGPRPPQTQAQRSGAQRSVAARDFALAFAVRDDELVRRVGCGMNVA